MVQMKFDMTGLTLVLGALVFFTNATVELCKLVFNVKGSTVLNKIALVTGVLSTVIVYFAYISYKDLSFIWYQLVGAVFVGFVVALMSMLGYDKVIQLWEKSKITR